MTSIRNHASGILFLAALLLGAIVLADAERWVVVVGEVIVLALYLISLILVEVCYQLDQIRLETLHQTSLMEERQNDLDSTLHDRPLRGVHSSSGSRHSD